MRHTVQRGCFEKEFRRLLREGSGAQRRAKDGLAAKEGRLSQTAPMIARILFPAAPPLAPDCPQVLIPLPRSTCAVTMLPNLGVSARRDHGGGPALGECVVALPLVIGPLGTDPADLSLHLRHYFKANGVIRDAGFAGHG